jgi:hypothetical protein
MEGGNIDMTDNGVSWASDYVLRMAEAEGVDEIEMETRVSYVSSVGAESPREITFGYIDAYFPGKLFDLKTGRERDYSLQALVYAASLCQRDSLDTLTVYLLYSDTRTVSTMTVSRSEAEEVVDEIVAKVQDPDKSPSVCGYCVWCAKKRTCHAFNPERNLRALSKACDKNLDALVDSFSKSMRIKDRNEATQSLKGLLADLTINGK